MQYSFKDILVGFRDRYLVIRQMLNELETNINILDEELNKCKILLNHETKEISIYFFEKEKGIISAIINIQKKIGLPIFNLENLSLDSNIKSFYYFKNNIKHYHIAVENVRKFNDLILQILGNDFIKMMQNGQIESSKKEKQHILEYNYNRLSQEDYTNSKISDINYYPSGDFIRINHLGTLNNKLLNNELNIKYNKNKFNIYQQNLIEKSKKDIVLYKEYDEVLDFNIEEEEKRLVLVKR
ncbi:MAG: hypothetical protein IJ068_02395 [Bacilli bacterium]|nr:hypothetical protein [Bacilli bacterium]